MITLNLKVFNSIGNNYQFNFLIPSTCRNIATKLAQFKARSNSPKTINVSSFTYVGHFQGSSALLLCCKVSFADPQLYLQVRLHFILQMHQYSFKKLFTYT